MRLQRLETLAFTALHVGFMARARARRYPLPAVAGAMAGIGAARLRPLAKASRGGLGSPSGTCAFYRTGHRYPKEQVSRTSPARSLAESGDATASPAIQGSPHEAPLVDEVSPICS